MMMSYIRCRDQERLVIATACLAKLNKLYGTANISLRFKANLLESLITAMTYYGCETTLWYTRYEAWNGSLEKTSMVSQYNQDSTRLGSHAHGVMHGMSEEGDEIVDERGPQPG